MSGAPPASSLSWPTSAAGPCRDQSSPHREHGAVVSIKLIARGVRGDLPPSLSSAETSRRDIQQVVPLSYRGRHSAWRWRTTDSEETSSGALQILAWSQPWPPHGLICSRLMTDLRRKHSRQTRGARHPDRRPQRFRESCRDRRRGPPKPRRQAHSPEGNERRLLAALCSSGGSRWVSKSWKAERGVKRSSPPACEDAPRATSRTVLGQISRCHPSPYPHPFQPIRTSFGDTGPPQHQRHVRDRPGHRSQDTPRAQENHDAVTRRLPG